MKVSHTVETKPPKPTVPPIRAKEGDEVVFPCGDKGRIYFFPETELFGKDRQVVSVEKGATTLPVQAKGPKTFRYAIWDNAAEDFLEGSSSPIIIVQ
jgi:hypothetical protein